MGRRLLVGAALAAAAALAVPGMGWASGSWNVATDFSATSNPHGVWTYGWSVSRGVAFTMLTTPVQVNGIDFWNGPPGFPTVPVVGRNGTGQTRSTAGTNPIPAGAVVVHPGVGGQNAVIRWTAPAAGTYVVQATWTGDDIFFGGTDAALLLDRTQLFAAQVVRYLGTQTYSGRLVLRTGDTLDFTTGFGADGGYSFDTTGVAIQIDQTDSTPPVVSVPAPITGEATGPDGAAVSFEATASDPDDSAGPVTCDPASASTFPVGTTTVTCSSTDGNGNTGTSSFDVTVQDTTPPALSGVPADFAVDATAPDGATASWPSPTADDLVDRSVPVRCTPGSGSTFAIGDTKVTCTATDTHGNMASAAFVVHVRGAAEQLDDLLAYVTGLGPGASLAAKVRTVEQLLSGGYTDAAGNVLEALRNEADAQAGKKLTPAQAAAIDTAVRRIQTVLGNRPA